MASVYVLLAIFLWSSLGVVVRLAGLEIKVLIFYSLITSLVVQAGIVSQKRFRMQIPPVRMMIYPAIFGFVTLLNSLAFFYAFQHTTVANAVLTHYTAPVIVAFLAPFFLKEKLTLKTILVIIIASIGLWIMLRGFSLAEARTLGILAGVASGFTYAFIIIFLRMHAGKFNPLILAFLTNIAMAVMLAPFIREIPTRSFWSFLFIGVVHSTAAPILYYRGLRGVSANRAAILGYIEPVSATLLGVLFLGEVPGAHSIIGGILIIFSGYLTLRGREG